MVERGHAMKRFFYLVCYDITDENRLRRVREFLTAHRITGQKSVAECWLSGGELAQVRRGLAKLVDAEADWLFLARIDPTRALVQHARRDAFDSGTGSFFLS